MIDECCDKPMREEVKAQIFPYMDIELTASFPVFFCDECGAAYFDGRGEEAREQAINIYLKTL